MTYPAPSIRYEFAVSETTEINPEVESNPALLISWAFDIQRLVFEPRLLNLGPLKATRGALRLRTGRFCFFCFVLFCFVTPGYPGVTTAWKTGQG